MKKISSYTLGISFIIFALTILIVEFLSSQQPTQYQRVSLKNFEFDFPADEIPQKLNSKGWEGIGGFEDQYLQIWYYPREPNKSSTEILTNLQSRQKNLVKAIPLNLEEGAQFFLLSHGKSFRRYIYVIVTESDILWLVHGSNNSSLITPKKILDHILMSFKVANKPISGINRAQLDLLDEQIIWYSHTTHHLYLFIGGIIIFVNILLAFLFQRFGKMPEAFTHASNKEEQVWISYKTKYNNQINHCAVVWDDSKIKIFFAKKLKYSISKKDKHKVSIMKIKDTNYLVFKDKTKTLQLELKNPYLWQELLNT